MAPDDPTTTDPSTPPPPPPGPPPGPPPAPPRLARSRTDRVAGGVAGGLGRYFGVDPILFRIAFVALTIAGGAGVAAYGAAWLLLPEDGENESIAINALKGHRAGDSDERRHSLIAIGLVVLVCIVLADSFRFARPWHGGVVFPLVLIAVAVALLRGRRDDPFHGRRTGRPSWPPAAPSTPASASASAPSAPSAPSAGDVTDPYEPFAPYPPSPYPDDPEPPARLARPPSLAGFLLGGLAVVGGVVAMLDVTGLVHVSLRGFLGAALVATGAALLLSIWRGGTKALVAVGLVLAAALGVTTLTNRPLHGGIGDRSWQPAGVSDLRTNYRLGIGNMTLDLSQIHLTEGSRHVNASLGIGELKVLVPEGVEVRASGHNGAGQVELFGDEHHGLNVDQTARDPGATADAPVLVLQTKVGIGHLDVERTPAAA